MEGSWNRWHSRPGPIVVAIVSAIDRRSFLLAVLSRYQSISDDAALKAFKSLARWNMYIALVQRDVLLGGTRVGIVWVSRDGLWPGLGTVLLANGMLLGLGTLLKGQEDRTRALPAATEELAAAHARVSDTWLYKATPDF